jgi:hypothetical protein
VLDLGPLLLFFFANSYGGIYFATGAFMVATVITLAISYYLIRRFPVMPIVTAVIVMVFGALTLWLHNDTFIKLKPTIIYVKPVLKCIEDADVKGISHITGGGFFENIPRCLPDGLSAKIEKAAIKTPAIFKMLQEKGNISEHDMFNTYNMGVGMAVIVSRETADAAISSLKGSGIDAYVIGEIVAGDKQVELW